MIRYHRKHFVFLTALFVPFLRYISPGFFSLMGVGPSWAVLWLLPWALAEGSFSGALAGASLGLILDAISLGDATQVPALVILGFWWGRLGRVGIKLEKIFALGLLGWIGSILLGLSLWLQLFFVKESGSLILFNAWSLHTLLAQSIMTSLLAPIVSSWLLLLFRSRRTFF